MNVFRCPGGLMYPEYIIVWHVGFLDIGKDQLTSLYIRLTCGEGTNGETSQQNNIGRCVIPAGPAQSPAKGNSA